MGQGLKTPSTTQDMAPSELWNRDAKARPGAIDAQRRPPTGVTRGLDPGVHLLRKKLFAKKMDCRVKPGNDGGKMVPAILGLFGRNAR